MKQLVRVRKLNPDGTAQVLHIRQSACSGDCHKCSGCGAAQETLLFTAENPIGAKPGDLVNVSSDSGPVLAGAAVLYMLPVVLFFAGYLLGHLAWGMGALVGCLAFVLGIVVAVAYDRNVAKKQKTVYTIIEFAAQM
ncbi:MAG: SoxR reducing system RseC family protein [Oscillospiraceae bacterium]|nr:SoxR reducing system RseC family protein [Oscillospiraceae bacterium]